MLYAVPHTPPRRKSVCATSSIARMRTLVQYCLAICNAAAYNKMLLYK